MRAAPEGKARCSPPLLSDLPLGLPPAHAQEGILKEHLEAAQRRAEAALASASLDERLVLQAQQAQQAKALRKAQVRRRGRAGLLWKVGRAADAIGSAAARWRSPCGRHVHALPTGLQLGRPPLLPYAQGEQLRAEVVAKMRERQEAAKRKREAAEKSRYRWARAVGWLAGWLGASFWLGCEAARHAGRAGHNDGVQPA